MLETTLDAGTYLLTAYGTDALPWSQGAPDDSLTVSYGFPEAPKERSFSFTLPHSGLATLALPAQPTAFFLSREWDSQAPVRLSLHPLASDGTSDVLSSQEASCQIAAKALVPQCATVAPGRSRHVALVRGEPGTRLTLQWAPYSANSDFEDGQYGTSSGDIRFRAPTHGEYLVGLHEVPLDTDSAPLGCVLEAQQPRGEWLPLAYDAPIVEAEHPLRRSFNYDGQAAALWFEVSRPGQYLLSTGGQRKSRCELYRFEGGKRTRLSDSKSEPCGTEQLTQPGLYELRLYGGTEGIEQLSVALALRAPKADSPTRTACLLPRVRLERGVRYRLVTNRATQGSLRGLHLRPLPLTLSEPLPVVLDGATPRELPLAPGGVLEVRAPGGEPFSCQLGGTPVDTRDGRCLLSSTTGTLSLSQAGEGSTVLWLQRPNPPPTPPQPVAFSPSLTPLPVLKPSSPAWFDFQREEAYSLTFDVKEAGLYHVTTLGLLATGCSIRTPVVPEVGSASGGGRGRNCLVSSYLRPGRYLLTARTLGASRGRAGVLLERRDVKRAESVSGDGEAFFRVEAGDLIQQRLTVRRAADYTLSTAAQGAQLQCRLDDTQGWPVVTVPTPCSQTLRLSKGSYLWTQLPLTVESMRRTALERVRPPRVLRGNKRHAVRFNSWYRASLGKDGKDEFTFAVPADFDVSFTLTHGMQGRLYLLAEGGALKPVELIPPQEAPSPVPSDEYVSEEEPSEERGEEPSEDEAPSEEYEGGESEQAPEEAREEETVVQARPAATVSRPEGFPLRLAPGRYVLITEHSRGDVAISYTLYLRTDVLAPPMDMEVEAPGTYALRVPADGTLRLNTRGDTDVRCRLFDEAGQLVAENADRGADWNCSLAEPLPAGDYTLVLESQTLQPGPTRVFVSLAEVKDAGPLAASGKLDVGLSVLRASLPPAPPDTLQEVTLRSRGDFSCALEDARGEVVHRRMDVRECTLLLKPGESSWRVRVWTVGRSTQVSATLASRPLRPLSGGDIPKGEAATAQVPQAGRYTTGRGLFCLPASRSGLLHACGPEASLTAGPWLFSTTGASDAARLALEERVDSLDAKREERVALARDVSLQRQRSRESTLHLLSVRVPFGDAANPACQLEGGVARQESFACHAATGPTQASLASWWTPSPTPDEATLTRLAVPPPAASRPLRPGLQEVAWTGGPTLRLELPAGPSRVQLSLPREAWAVLMDAQGATRDVCAPSESLSRCVLSGSGGALFVYSPAEPRVQAELLSVEVARRAEPLVRLFEDTFPAPTQQRLTFASADTSRRLAVTGAARCVATLDDGTRLEGCEAQVPPGHPGELSLEAEPGALRVVLAPQAGLSAALLAAPTFRGATPELPEARALTLAGRGVERTFTLPKEAVVHVRADSGVCGLAQGDTVRAAEGLAAGCAVDTLLPAGTWRLVVRGFGGQPLTGTVAWTQEPVKVLSEGVASEESWLAPGQTRYFRFSTSAAGNVGLGVRQPSELLECTVLESSSQRVLGEGCQQLLSLEKGTYLLALHAPASARPIPFQPVLVGLAGTRTDIPEAYLRDFFQRIGGNP